MTNTATEAVRDHPNGQRLLGRQWQLREVVKERLGEEIPDPDDLADGEDDTIDLDRAVCAIAGCDVDATDELG